MSSVHDLDDICDRLEDIKQEIHDSREGGFYYAIVGIALYLLVSGGLSAAWHSKWRYSIQYGVPDEKIHRADKPHDCAFLAAPLGEKYCHYKLVLTTVRWATSITGNPIVSYDEGKTWSIFAPEVGSTVPKYPTVEDVDLGWEKVDE